MITHGWPLGDEAVPHEGQSSRVLQTLLQQCQQLSSRSCKPQEKMLAHGPKGEEEGKYGWVRQ